MRDKILPQAQSQIDELAAQMSQALSDQTTNGTAVTSGSQSGFSVDIGGVLPGNSVQVGYTDALNNPRTVTIVRVDDPGRVVPEHHQGPDHGHQYRSAIFFHNAEQETAARKSKEQAQRYFDRPIVTEIVPLAHFWPAEEYHQHYFDKHSGHYSCHFIRGWVPKQPAEAEPAR